MIIEFRKVINATAVPMLEIARQSDLSYPVVQKLMNGDSFDMFTSKTMLNLKKFMESDFYKRLEKQKPTPLQEKVVAAKTRVLESSKRIRATRTAVRLYKSETQKQISANGICERYEGCNFKWRKIAGFRTLCHREHTCRERSAKI